VEKLIYLMGYRFRELVLVNTQVSVLTTYIISMKWNFFSLLNM